MYSETYEGEMPLQDAPVVKIDEGVSCIPQHYLKFNHSRQSIAHILRECRFTDDYLILAGEDTQGLFIQIAVIGYDTYKPRTGQPVKKLVYGRRWRIECQLPTSELIQTVFLALKKAREHEVRERFKLRLNGQYSAPFSCHQDLPLIAATTGRLRSSEQPKTIAKFRREVVALSNNLLFDNAMIQLVNIEPRANGQLLVDVALHHTALSELPECRNGSFTLVLEQASTNDLLFALMDKFISLSDTYVAEHFYFRNVARFSQQLSAVKLATLSLTTRQRQHSPTSDVFYRQLAAHNQCIDESRAPKVITQSLYIEVIEKLTRFGKLNGFRPLAPPSQSQR